MNRSHLFSVFGMAIFLWSQSLQAQTELKFNVASAALLIPNVGIEIAVSKHSSVQLDVLASFWDSFNGKPLQIIQVFPEYRYYFQAERQGFFLGAHVGFGMFTMQKPGFAVIYDQYQDPSTYTNPDGSYQSGRATFYGLTAGFKKRFSSRWGLELFLGAGLAQSNYKGYNKFQRTDVTETNYRDFNGSGEWLLYRGGLMLVYRLN
ncbi:DUF3575 domain-containing protein [Bizionia sediminis]|uniref:DUF3575 domain-containing protein n=1 Tax=Bizionia sediminis TaxID=1737064 RepID=A0ABW5KTR2_9FLAO